eukprot:TRINITY_DN7405_c0_g1_i2.p1 TRINITY_DN7405_c0_g1~~TRINITY_DN7405_c0_g1_i2.p1  ORF type:complete len:1142 (+),score=199.84 TRINITY_DN7405_c0_g1_i2:39-3464(+)
MHQRTKRTDSDDIGDDSHYDRDHHHHRRHRRRRTQTHCAEEYAALQCRWERLKSTIHRTVHPTIHPTIDRVSDAIADASAVRDLALQLLNEIETLLSSRPPLPADSTDPSQTVQPDPSQTVQPDPSQTVQPDSSLSPSQTVQVHRLAVDLQPCEEYLAHCSALLLRADLIATLTADSSVAIPVPSLSLSLSPSPINLPDHHLCASNALRSALSVVRPRPSPHTAHHSLDTAHHSPLTAHHSLHTAHHSLHTAHKHPHSHSISHSLQLHPSRIVLTRAQHRLSDLCTQHLLRAREFSAFLQTRDVLGLPAFFAQLSDLMAFSACLQTPKERLFCKELLIKIFDVMDALDFPAIIEILAQPEAAMLLTSVLDIVGEYAQGPRIPGYIEGRFDPIAQHQRHVLRSAGVQNAILLLAQQITEESIRISILSCAKKLCLSSQLFCDIFAESQYIEALLGYFSETPEYVEAHFGFMKLIAPFLSPSSNRVLRTRLSGNEFKYIHNPIIRRGLYEVIRMLHRHSSLDDAVQTMHYLNSINHEADDDDDELFPLVYTILLQRFSGQRPMLSHFDRDWVQELTCRVAIGLGKAKDDAISLLTIVSSGENLEGTLSTFSFQRLLSAALADDADQSIHGLLGPISSILSKRFMMLRSVVVNEEPRITRLILRLLTKWMQDVASQGEGEISNVPLLRHLLQFANVLISNGLQSLACCEFFNLLAELVHYLELQLNPQFHGFKQEIKRVIHQLLCTCRDGQRQLHDGLHLNDSKPIQLVQHMLDVHFGQKYLDSCAKIKTRSGAIVPVDDAERLWALVSSVRGDSSVDLSADGAIVQEFKRGDYKFINIESVTPSHWTFAKADFVEVLMLARYNQRQQAARRLFHMSQNEDNKSVHIQQAVEIFNFLQFTLSAHGGKSTSDAALTHPVTRAVFGADYAGTRVSEGLFLSTLAQLTHTQSEPMPPIVISSDVAYTESYFVDLVVKEYGYSKEYVSSVLQACKTAMTSEQGKLSRQEFHHALRDLLDANFARHADGFFRMFDQDNSGSIDLVEAVVGLCKLKLGSNEWVAEYAFRLMDEDHSGYITRKEFTIFVDKYASQPNIRGDIYALTKGMFDVYDADADECISLVEFQKAMDNPALRDILSSLLQSVLEFSN